jgi:dihydrofolate reductase
VRTLEYLVATSIDGFIARVDGDFTPLLVEGDHLQALAEEVPETFPAQARQALGIDAPNRRFDTVLMGAGTYQVPGGLPSPYPHLRQYVVSRSVRAPADVAVLPGDLLGQVRALKQEDGLSIWLCGGSTLAGQLLPEIDTLLLEVSPVVLGSGLPLFAVDAPTARFAPPTVRRFADGVVVLEYRRSEPPWVLISPGRRVRSRRRARPGGRGRARRAWSAAGRRRCGPSPGRGTAPARSPRWTGPVPPARAPPAPAR